VIGIDTNVLVRYLSQDDARQSASATRLIEAELSQARLGYIGLIVLVELCWVLERSYAATPKEIVSTVSDLLSMPQFEIQQREAVQRAVAAFQAQGSKKASLADHLIAATARDAGCEFTLSFDAGAARLAGMRLLA
jgi:predicted nucleic-acid-binding protein